MKTRKQFIQRFGNRARFPFEIYSDAVSFNNLYQLFKFSKEAEVFFKEPGGGVGDFTMVGFAEEDPYEELEEFVYAVGDYLISVKFEVPKGGPFTLWITPSFKLGTRPHEEELEPQPAA